jgi:hypothetical protein
LATWWSCVLIVALTFLTDSNPAQAQDVPPASRAVSSEGVVDRLQVTGQTLEARGWAGSGDPQNPVVAIRILLDGIEIYKGSFETQQRPDVARAKGNPEWLQSGWSIKAPLQAPLSEGNKKITATAILKNSDHFDLRGQKVLSSQAHPPVDNSNLFQIEWIAVGLLLALSGYSIYRRFIPSSQKIGDSTFDYHVLAIALGVALTLVTIVALKSQFNKHPDEKGHFNAVEYYSENWVKKRVDSSEMLKALIPSWGISYLNSNNVVYFFINKTTYIFGNVEIDSFVKYRLFNVILFLILILTLKIQTWEGFCVLVAANFTPQVWYIFSYINGDAFAFFLSLVACYYFLRNKDTIIQSFWQKSRPGYQVYLFSLLCCGILFVKLNYYLVIPFLFCIIFVQGIQSRNFKIFTGRACVFASVLFVVFLGDRFYDSRVNDFRKKELMLEVKKAHASPALIKENIMITRSNPHLMWAKEFGISFYDLFFKKNLRWFTNSYRSFIGRFGYMKLFCSNEYYLIYSIIAFVPIFIFLTVGFWVSSPATRILLIIGLMFIGAAVLQSMFYSWTYGFQAQGRYIFPAIPILAATCASVNQTQNNPFIRKWFLILLIFNIYGYAAFAVAKF